MSGALVSVVMPVFNGERFLAEAIESVLAQTWSPVELIVVDDGSSDGSAEIARSYPVTYLHQENAGVAAARNRGAEAAGGELFAFLDQDDLWLPEKLERQLARLDEDPEAGICACKVDIFLEPGCDRPGWMDRAWLDTNKVTTQVGALLVKREVFEQVGPFDTRYVTADDTDWLLRAREAGVRFVVVDETLHRYRVHENNTSAKANPLETVRAFRAAVERKRAREA